MFYSLIHLPGTVLGVSNEAIKQNSNLIFFVELTYILMIGGRWKNKYNNIKYHARYIKTINNMRKCEVRYKASWIVVAKVCLFIYC